MSLNLEEVKMIVNFAEKISKEQGELLFSILKTELTLKEKPAVSTAEAVAIVTKKVIKRKARKRAKRVVKPKVEAKEEPVAEPVEKAEEKPVAEPVAEVPK